MRLQYLKEDHLEPIFDVIYKNLASEEAVPVYSNEKQAIYMTLGVFESIKQRYYPRLADKAAKLLIEINNGQFFSNGNKRLSLVCTLNFIFLNDYSIKELANKTYENRISELFPNYQYESLNLKNTTPEESAYYNLTLIIAEGRSYTSSNDDLRKKVREFVKFSVFRKNY